ncbi:MAG TPA: vWA domain-containing protein [Pseudacidobacterium sp.]|nr:vWA domain-containing protein [Pseudacidobacterium sp.]
MRLVSSIMLAGVLAIPGGILSADTPSALHVTEPVSLQDCSPVTLAPCFRLGVIPVDESGAPAGVLLPPEDRLTKAVSIETPEGAISPFYVKADAGPNATAKLNVVLIEIDISGSMNQQVAPGTSRFEAARQAIQNYLASMQDGVDEVAIVPFESHHVVPTLQAAVFTSKRDQAIAQLNALPTPGPKNNTALYQAVFTGVNVLDSEVARLEKAGTSRSNLTPQLIVMTDGKNEVLRGDDDDLLDGDLGLEQASAKVHSAGAGVIGIGFGDPVDIDVDALRRLSTRFFLATDPAQLAQAFRSSAPVHPSNLEIAFLPSASDRQSLAARNSHFVVVLHLLDGKILTSPSIDFVPPAIATPLYKGHIGYEALQALSAFEPPTISGWSTVLRGILVFIGLGVVLLLLWFWIPRIVWRNEPGGLTAVRRRWSKEPTVQASGVQVRNAPNGFDSESAAGQPQRTAAQITQVRLRTEFTNAGTTERK